MITKRNKTLEYFYGVTIKTYLNHASIEKKTNTSILNLYGNSNNLNT